jgi:hypothetical protein
MPALPRLNTESSRRRRTFCPWNSKVETLEIRSLLSSAAVIQWSMLPQITRDPVRGNQPELPHTSAYVNPPNGYSVLLDASHSVGIRPTKTFSWTIIRAGVLGPMTSIGDSDETVTTCHSNQSICCG